MKTKPKEADTLDIRAEIWSDLTPQTSQLYWMWSAIHLLGESATPDKTLPENINYDVTNRETYRGWQYFVKKNREQDLKDHKTENIQ